MKSLHFIFSLVYIFLLLSCGSSVKTDNAQLEADISPVIPKINGTVLSVLVQDNQVVQEGDTLVLIDDETYRIAVGLAEVALEQAKKNVELAIINKGAATFNVTGSQANSAAVKANYKSAQAAVEAAKVKLDLAVLNFSRMEQLYKENAIPQQQLDLARAEKEGNEQAFKIAEGTLIAAQKQVEASQAQIATTQSGVQSSSDNIAVAELSVKHAEYQLEMAKLQLSYCVIKAPASGVVTKKNVQKGQVVSIGQPILAITDHQKVWVVANFKETQLAKMKIGQPVEIRVDAFDDKVFAGEVASFAQATGAKFSLLPPDNATGNFVKVTQRVPVKIRLLDQPQDQFQLKAGMSVSVQVKTEN